MAQGGLLGNGVKVGVSTGSPVSWTRVLQVTDVVPPNFAADKVNIDTHSTTNNLHRNRAGLNAVSDATITTLSDLNPVTNPGGELLRLANLNGTTIWVRIEIPVNDARDSFRSVEFSCTVSGFNPSTPIADKQTTQYTLVFNGDSVGWSASVAASSIT
jgi:hypothetical protein